MSGSSLADVRKMREDRVDDCQSRILHQHDRRHTEAVRRAAVDVAHLRGCQDLHWLMASGYFSRSSAVSISDRAGRLATLDPASRIFWSVVASTLSLPQSMSSAKIDESNA